MTVTSWSWSQTQGQLLTTPCLADRQVLLVGEARCLFRNLATWGDGRLVSPNPRLSCQSGKELLNESVEGLQVVATCRAAQSALTSILKLWCRLW